MFFTIGRISDTYRVEFYAFGIKTDKQVREYIPTSETAKETFLFGYEARDIPIVKNYNEYLIAPISKATKILFMRKEN